VPLRSHAPRLYAVATALIVVHLLDDAFVNPPGGTSFSANLATIAAPLAIAVGLAIAFRRFRPGVQAWTAFVVGAVAFADGGLHVAHIRRAGAASADDLTGLVSGLGGAVMIALAVAIVFRPKAQRSRTRRWLLRAGAAVGAALTVFFVVMPLGVAVYLVHKQPVDVPSAKLPVPHEDVTLRSSDGQHLAAWYVHPRNGAVVVLVHGAGGDRTGGIESRALMLVRHGYGVLLYDARGDGDSTGRPESFGWTWHRDTEAAVDFLGNRGVTRIGALGLSTGAEVVLETAGRDPRIRAVVAEGAQARSYTELRSLPVTPSNMLASAYVWEMLAGYRMLAHTSPPPSLAVMVAHIAPRPIFLISSGRDYERDMNRAYARDARGPVTLWEMPSVQHTGGLAAYPREYDQRVTGFFDKALLGTATTSTAP
jgi:uncharacterized protein